MSRRKPRAFGWGGRREGAGRKPSGDKPGVSHLRRPDVMPGVPIYIAMRTRSEIPSLRRAAIKRIVGDAVERASQTPGFRITEHTCGASELRLTVLAKDRTSLSRGMQSLSIRVAKGINRLIGRTGGVFADRYAASTERT